jgi:DNA-binding transcriptional MocR family regulator
MSDDVTINRPSIRHAYQQVADALAARIAVGEYPCKLPAELDLAAEFGVSYSTVRHAMAIPPLMRPRPQRAWSVYLRRPQPPKRPWQDWRCSLMSARSRSLARGWL